MVKQKDMINLKVIQKHGFKKVKVFISRIKHNTDSVQCGITLNNWVG